MLVRTWEVFFVLAWLAFPVIADSPSAKGEPTASTAAPPPQSEQQGKPNLEQVSHLIVEKTNEFRQEQHRQTVETNPKLAETARDFASFMARTDKYGHTVDGRQPGQRAEQHGYAYCLVSENIAYQYSSAGFSTQGLAEKLFEGWKHSPEHRQNMLDPDVKEIGVAVAQSQESGRYYAVQMFGRPKSESIEFEVANQTDATIKYEISNQKFSLPPHYIETHQQCDSSEVRFALPNGQEKRAKIAAVKPASGDHFVVMVERGEFRVIKK